MDGDGFREWRARELKLRGCFVEVGGGALRVEAGFFCGELDLDEPFARRAGFFWPRDDLVDEKDVQGMADKMIALARDPERWDAYGTAGRKLLESEFAVPIVQKRLRSILAGPD